MTSEIRANTLKNRVGLGTVSFTNTGPVVSGIVTIANSTSEGVRLEDNAGVGNSLKITTPTGYVSIGSGNSTFVHLETDRGVFYFQKRIFVDEGIIGSYDENLILQSPSNTTRITINKDTGLVSIVNDLDVDGHTNLDNVSVAGVTTFTGRSDHSSSLQMLAGNNIVLLNDANSANCQIDCYGGAGFRVTSYNQTMFTCENGGTTKFYTNNGNSRLEITNAGDVQVITGNLDIPDALRHYGDNDTKIRFPAADQIQLDAGGTNYLKLHRYSSVNFVEVGASAQLSLADNGSGNRFIVIGDGNASSTGALKLQAGGGSTGWGGGITMYSHANSTNAGGVYIGKSLNSSGSIIFGNGGTSATNEYLRITSGGDLGLGDNNPNIRLTVVDSGTENLVRLGRSDGNSHGSHTVNIKASKDFYHNFKMEASSYQLHTYTGSAMGERFRITSAGDVGIGVNDPDAKLEVLEDIFVKGSSGDGSTGIQIRSGSSALSNQHQIRTGGGSGNMLFLEAVGDTGIIAMKTAGTERLRITSDGDIYGPSGGRKNWFDNGSFDCTYGGRKQSTSMDYGNHHAYGWVTDRFMSRNSVQWSRSTNVPTGKGFSYSTYTNGAGGSLMQAVELPDYGDMGVFTPGSYWCVSVWSTAGLNHGGSGFSYDLGSTKTDIPGVGSGTYATTGETASGTSTGTFNRYYRVYGPMPSSIISGAIAAYWQWGFSAQGYSTGWQLERVPTSTSKPTPYEHVHPSVTIARCRRYAYRVYNSRHVCGWKRHDSNVNWEARHPVLPTHMPSGSNQSADPYGVIMHTAGLLTNFQSVWQNPAVSALYRYGFNPADGSFILYGTSSYSGTHLVIPSYEGFEYEVQHGFF